MKSQESQEMMFPLVNVKGLRADGFKSGSREGTKAGSTGEARYSAHLFAGEVYFPLMVAPRRATTCLDAGKLLL